MGSLTTRGPFPRWPLCGRRPPQPGVGHQARSATGRITAARVRTDSDPSAGERRQSTRVAAFGFSRQAKPRALTSSARTQTRQKASAGQGQRAKQVNPQGWPAQRRRRGEAQGSRAPEAAMGSSPWPRGSGSPVSETDGPAGLVQAGAPACQPAQPNHPRSMTLQRSSQHGAACPACALAAAGRC